MFSRIETETMNAIIRISRVMDGFEGVIGSLNDSLKAQNEILEAMAKGPKPDPTAEGHDLFLVTFVTSDCFPSGRQTLHWQSTDPENAIKSAYEHYCNMFKQAFVSGSLDDPSEKHLDYEEFRAAMLDGFSGGDDYALIQCDGGHMQYEGSSIALSEPVLATGNWTEDTHTYAGPGVANYKCTNCGELIGTWRKGLTKDQLWDYCPVCGARMIEKV